MTLRIHLPGSLRSTGITPFHHSYGASDSCPAHSTEQVSLLHATQTSHHSVSNHLMRRVMAFSCYPSASRAFQFLSTGNLHSGFALP